MVYIEGNNGGDFLGIEPLGNNLVELAVGHCCVKEISHIVPVEFITGILSDAVVQHGSIEDAIQAIGWPLEFSDRLCAQVKSIREADNG